MYVPRISLLALALLSGPVVSGAQGLPAQGLDPTQPVSFADKSAFGPSPRAIDAYWTPERMRDAAPYPPLARRGGGRSLLEPGGLGDGRREPESPLELHAGGYPLMERHKDRLTQQSMFEVEDLERARPEGAEAPSYPPPYTRLEVFTSYERYPYRAVGRVFFHSRADGRDYYCSGAAAGGRTVWTAGRCVHSGGVGGGWHERWVFAPAYKDGRAPFGLWPARELWSVRGWTSYGSQAHDLGMVVTRDRGGRRLDERVGWLGSMFGARRQQHWNVFGYPSRLKEGRRLYVCQTGWAGNRSTSGPDPVGAGCDLLAGSVGGPWVVRLDGRAGAYNFVNGVGSFHGRVWGSGQPVQYAAYFGAAARRLFHQVRNR